jgi:antitoxin ParD1/3/4
MMTAMDEFAPITLDEQSAGFVSAQLRAGRYDSAEEMVAAALRLLQHEEERYEALADALAEGEASGDPQPFDFDAFIADKVARAKSR